MSQARCTSCAHELLPPFPQQGSVLLSLELQNWASNHRAAALVCQKWYTENKQYLNRAPGGRETAASPAIRSAVYLGPILTPLWAAGLPNLLCSCPLHCYTRAVSIESHSWWESPSFLIAAKMLHPLQGDSHPNSYKENNHICFDSVSLKSLDFWYIAWISHKHHKMLTSEIKLFITMSVAEQNWIALILFWLSSFCSGTALWLEQ